MAFFKFRKGGDESPAAPPQPESVEALRRRARHRLIGAAVLVLLGVIGFPLLFDTQPRPVAVDIPIEIPDRNKARPLPAPAPARTAASAGGTAPASAGSAVVAAAPALPPAAPAARPPVVAGPVSAAPEPRPQPTDTKAAPAEAKAPVEPKPAPVATARPAAPASAEAKVSPAPADSARAQALLEGKPVQASAQEAEDGRFVVQVGAFADAAKARETRLKVERAGLKTYTHVAETKDGKRIRVRVGPFATRAEADKAAGRIKELDLPAAILTL